MSWPAIRVENPKVFETIHQLALSNDECGTVTGVRIDHIDGLQDPKEYLEALQRRSVPDRTPTGNQKFPDNDSI